MKSSKRMKFHQNQVDLRCRRCQQKSCQAMCSFELGLSRVRVGVRLGVLDSVSPAFVLHRFSRKPCRAKRMPLARVSVLIHHSTTLRRGKTTGSSYLIGIRNANSIITSSFLYLRPYSALIPHLCSWLARDLADECCKAVYSARPSHKGTLRYHSYAEGWLSIS